MHAYDTNLFIDTQMVPAPWSVNRGLRFEWAYVNDYGATLNYDAQLDVSIQVDEFIQKEERAQQHHRTWHEERRIARNRFQLKISALRRGEYNPFPSRFVNWYIRDDYQIRTLFKDLGRAVAQGETLQVIDLLRQIGREYSGSLATHIYNKICERTNLVQCHNCEAFIEDNGEYQTIGGSSLCSECVCTYYHWSDCQEGYVHRNRAMPVYLSRESYDACEADDWCSYSYADNELYVYGDAAFNTRELQLYAGYVPDPDDDDYYEVVNTGGHLGRWHTVNRDFVERNRDGMWPALGVELEVYARNRYDTVEKLRGIYDTDTMYMERDGSLDDDHGFEIITQPLGRSEWDKLAPNLCKTLIDSETVGYNEPAGKGYGIHVSIHRRHLSPLAEARISMFLSAVTNATFVRAVSQRNQIYCHEHGYGFGAFSRPNINNIGRHLRDTWNQERGCYQRKIAGRGKYCPVNWKKDIGEFRIFQSTVNPSTFMKNLEFVWALQRWTLDATGCSYSYVDFLKWLNQPENRLDYPQLVAFLSKRQFYGTNFMSFGSPWQHLMMKPVQTDAVEPMAA